LTTGGVSRARQRARYCGNIAIPNGSTALDIKSSARSVVRQVLVYIWGQGDATLPAVRGTGNVEAAESNDYALFCEKPPQYSLFSGLDIPLHTKHYLVRDSFICARRGAGGRARRPRYFGGEFAEPFRIRRTGPSR
jgi:hypothetical protein